MIEFEANEVGTYAVVVSARTVPSGGSQPYALVVRGPKDVPSAPTFGENPGPVEAVVGQMAEFEVTASGYPIPVVQLQSTTASANSYDVDAGYCVYEPPWEDIGTQTFMFTASNSLGVATQVVSVYVTEAAPDAPASMSAPMRRSPAGAASVSKLCWLRMGLLRPQLTKTGGAPLIRVAPRMPRC